MLHPQFKTKYFSDANWKEDWISTAKNLLRNEWKDYYKPAERTAENNTARRPPPPRDDAGDDEDMFAVLHARRKAPKTTELEAFIRDDPVISEFTENPVKYWYAKREDPFARMALDFVSAPGKMPCTHRSVNLLTFFQLPPLMLSVLSQGGASPFQNIAMHCRISQLGQALSFAHGWKQDLSMITI